MRLRALLKPSAATQIKPYFEHAMRKWNLSPEAERLAWINATHDFSRALKMYRAIFILDLYGAHTGRKSKNTSKSRA